MRSPLLNKGFSIQTDVVIKPESEPHKILSPLAALDYRGQRYRITNPASAPTPESTSWNRDVFRLVVELASQNTIDTSKYPLPTNLQVLPSP